MFRESFRITAYNIVSRGIGFAFPVILASLFGATVRTDAFYLASTVPNFVTQIAVITLSTVFVPIFVERMVQTEDSLSDIASSTLSWLVLLSLLLGLLLITLAYLALPWLNQVMDQNLIQLTFQLTIGLLPLLPIGAAAGIASALLNSHKRYVGPIIAPGIRGAIAICFTLAGYKQLGIFAAVYGLLVGELGALAFLMHLVKGSDIRLRINFEIYPSIKKALRLALPLMISMIVLRFNPIIDQFMAAPLGQGSLTSLNFADKVTSIPITLISTGFFVVLLTQWSEIVAYGDFGKLQIQLEEALSAVAFVIMPISAFMIAMRLPIIALLFGRGAFGGEALAVTSDLLGILALGLVPFMTTLVLNRVFLAMQITQVPMYLGFGNAVLNLLLNLSLIGTLGLLGIALSTTVTYYVLCVSALFILYKRFQIHLQKSFFVQFAQISVSSIAIFWILRLIRVYGEGLDNLLLLIVAGGIGLAAYVLISYTVGVPHIILVLNRLRTIVYGALDAGA